MIVKCLDKNLIPDPEVPDLYMEEGIHLKVNEDLFGRIKEKVRTFSRMVIPIPKHRRITCLAAFMFVAVLTV